MWKLHFLFVSLIVVCLSNTLLAQVPQGISYQAVARTSEGAELAGQSIFIQISIRGESIDGPIEWQEEHGVTTNEFGLFSLIIGNGNSTGLGSAPSFSAVSWALSDHFLQVELDPGDGVYELMGITQLLSVPYAFVAGKVLDNEDADADPQNELISSVDVSGSVLSIEEAGITHSVDLQEALADGDELVGNESLTLIQLQGTILNLVESGQAFSVELESLSNDEDWIIEEQSVYNLDRSIGIGTSAPSSSLHVNGSLSSAVLIYNSDLTLELNGTHHIIICNVADQSLEMNLPPANEAVGREYIFKKISIGQPELQPITNTVSITPVSGEFVDGNPQLLLDSFFREELTLVSDGAQWWIIARSTNE